MSPATLLYVDSKIHDRRSLVFLLKNTYRIVTAATLSEADAILQTNTVDMILCDHQLPDGSGLEFLIKIQEKYPECFRMLQTAVASGKQVMRAINEGHIYYYFHKPLQETELKMVLDNAMELKMLKDNNARLISSLETKNTDLEQSESLFRSLLEHVPDGVLICNTQGIIMMVNNGTETLFSTSARQLIGMPVSDLFQKGTFESLNADSPVQEVSACRPDGAMFPAELTRNITLDNDTMLTILVVRDISERRSAEIQLRDLNVRLEQKVVERTAALERVNRQLSRQEKRKDILRRVASASNSSLHDSALETCLWEICRFLDLDFGQIWLVGEEGILENSGVSCAPRFAGPRRARWLPDHLGSLVSLSSDILLSTEVPKEAQEILAAGFKSKKPEKETIHGLMAFPVRVKGRTEAIFEFLSVRPIAMDDWSRGIVQDIAVEMSELFLRRDLEMARSQVLAALQKSETRFRNLIESATAIAWEMTWPELSLQYVSPGAENILGYSRESWYDYDFWERVIVPDDRYSFENQLNECVSRGTQVSFEFRLFDMDGHERWLRCFAYPMRGLSAHEGEKLSGIMFDITALKEAQMAAVQASSAKSAFLAVMSHELRTPLNGIIGLVELLLRSSLDHDQLHMLSTTRESAFTLLQLIDDILDFSKIEAGKLELEHIDFHVPQIVESVAENLAPIAHKRELRLELIFEADVPVQVIGDSIRFRQILMNIVGNALKFTSTTIEQKGIVVIRVSASGEEGAGPGWFRIEIEDNGIGMSPEVQRRLFQPFSQGEESTTRRFGGTGLGLSIVGRLVEQMGGSISVKSQEGSGSVFTVDFRLVSGIPVVPDFEGILDPSHSHHLQSSSFILASDRIEFEALHAVSLRMGFQPFAFESLESLIEYCMEAIGAEQNPVVFVGIGKRLSNAGLARLRHVVPRCRIVTLVERGHQPEPSENGDVLLAYGNPVLPSNLLRALAGSSLGPELNFGNELQKNKRPHLKKYEANLVLRHVLIAEDNPTNQLVLVRQLETLGYTAQLASDGREALEVFGKDTFDMILTDCHMPFMDGFELLAAIRKKEESTHHHTPIVAITANAVHGEVERCIELGFDDCVTKPANIETLKLTIDRLFADKDGNSGNQEKMAIRSEIAYTEERIVDFDPDSISEYVGDDSESQKLLMGNFLKNLPELSEEIAVSMAEGDLKRAGFLAHSLKASAKTVGAQRLSAMCQNLESFSRGHKGANLDFNADDFMNASLRARTAMEQELAQRDVQ